MSKVSTKEYAVVAVDDSVLAVAIEATAAGTTKPCQRRRCKLIKLLAVATLLTVGASVYCCRHGFKHDAGYGMRGYASHNQSNGDEDEHHHHHDGHHGDHHGNHDHHNDGENQRQHDYHHDHFDGDTAWKDIRNNYHDEIEEGLHPFLPPPMMDEDLSAVSFLIDEVPPPERPDDHHHHPHPPRPPVGPDDHHHHPHPPHPPHPPVGPDDHHHHPHPPHPPVGPDHHHHGPPPEEDSGSSDSGSSDSGSSDSGSEDQAVEQYYDELMDTEKDDILLEDPLPEIAYDGTDAVFMEDIVREEEGKEYEEATNEDEDEEVIVD